MDFFNHIAVIYQQRLVTLLANLVDQFIDSDEYEDVIKCAYYHQQYNKEIAKLNELRKLCRHR